LRHHRGILGSFGSCDSTTARETTTDIETSRSVIAECARAIGVNASTASESDYPAWFRTLYLAGWRLPGIVDAIARARRDEAYRALALTAAPDAATFRDVVALASFRGIHLPTLHVTQPGELPHGQ